MTKRRFLLVFGLLLSSSCQGAHVFSRGSIKNHAKNAMVWTAQSVVKKSQDALRALRNSPTLRKIFKPSTPKVVTMLALLGGAGYVARKTLFLSKAERKKRKAEGDDGRYKEVVERLRLETETGD